MNKLGKIGEDTATHYLEKMKYKILKEITEIEEEKSI